MTTGEKRLNIVPQRIVGSTSFQDNFFDFLRDDFKAGFSKIYRSAGAFASLGLQAGSAVDQFTINKGGGALTDEILAIDGNGYFLNLKAVESYLQNVPFENVTGNTYHVAMRMAEVPDGLYVNPRSGMPQFDTWKEHIGWSGVPDAAVDNGTTMTFTVDGITESGVSHAGRKVIVFKNNPGLDAQTISVAVEELTVVWDATNNKITTVAQFGQSSPSTIASDYTVVLLGPRTSRTVNLKTLSPWFFVGTITGNGPSTSPTVFDITEQNLIDVPLADFADIVRYENASGSDKLKVDVTVYTGDEATDQIRVTDPTHGTPIRFKVTGEGDVVAEGDLTVNGSAIVSDFAGDILPATDVAYDLGSPSAKWNLYADVVSAGNTSPRGDDSYNLGTSVNRWDRLFVTRIEVSLDGDAAVNLFESEQTYTYFDSKSAPLRFSDTSGGTNEKNWLLETKDVASNQKLLWGAVFDNWTSPNNFLEVTRGVDSTDIDDVSLLGTAINLSGTNITLTGTGDVKLDATTKTILEAPTVEVIGNLLGDVTATRDLGSSSVKWKRLYLSDVFGDGVAGNLMPTAHSTYNLGGNSARWKQFFLNNSPGDGVGTDLNPTSDASFSLGSSSYKWSNVYSNETHIISAGPELHLRDTDAPTDTERWLFQLYSNGTDTHEFRLRMTNDAASGYDNVFVVNRNTGANTCSMNFSSDLLPTGTRDLGASGSEWSEIHGTVVYTDELDSNGTEIDLNKNLYAGGAGVDIGQSSQPFGEFFANDIQARADSPTIDIHDLNSTSTERHWSLNTAGANFQLYARADDGTGGSPALIITRSGTTPQAFEFYGDLLANSNEDIGSSSKKFGDLYLSSDALVDGLGDFSGGVVIPWAANPSGETDHITYLGAWSSGSAGADFQVVGLSGATTRDSAGFIWIKVGTDTVYVPYFSDITG